MSDTDTSIRFVLSVNGKELEQIDHDFSLSVRSFGNQVVDIKPTDTTVVVWKNGKDTKTKYFWFKINNVSYILRSEYRSHNGLFTVLAEITKQGETITDVKNILRKSKDVRRIGGNESFTDAFLYRKTIMKREDCDNVHAIIPYEIRLKAFKPNDPLTSTADIIVVD
jgi:hypothetical protein